MTVPPDPEERRSREFGDIFDAFFGGREGRRTTRGDDLRYDLTITFEEAFAGVEKEIEVLRLVSCQACSGSGARSGTESPCAECRGEGRVERSRHLRVRVPAGVDTGSQLRLAREGEAGHRGGPPGDLYVVLRVRDHAALRRQGADVRFDLRVNVIRAATGDRIEVPTLDGPVELTIPPGTQHGQTFRLPGRGMPDLRSGRRGDQVVVVQAIDPD